MKKLIELSGNKEDIEDYISYMTSLEGYRDFEFKEISEKTKDKSILGIIGTVAGFITMGNSSKVIKGIKMAIKGYKILKGYKKADAQGKAKTEKTLKARSKKILRGKLIK